MLRKFALLLLVVFSSSVFAQVAQINKLPDFTGLVEEHGAAVVNISAVRTQSASNNQILPEMPSLPEDSPFYDFFRRQIQPFPNPRRTEPKSMGSGFIISSDGYILTNAHVVLSAEEITVKLSNKREFSAKIIGTDSETDIALIKIEANDLPKITQGDPDKLKVGEWVVAIGSPFGFEQSVTAGIVSAKGRTLAQENYVPFIQTDVAINPGNSGGPLFNMAGEVVGINSQIYSRTGGFMGLSFAIPINVATEIAAQLKETGKVNRGRIGVVIQEMTEELAESFGLANHNGALVVSVQKDSPAEKAGIKVRDVILKFDGKDVTASSYLPRIVGNSKPGSQILMQVWRDGGIKMITIVVGDTHAESNAETNEVVQKKTPDIATVNRIGLTLSALTDDQKEELEINDGVLVLSVMPGVAGSAGMNPGDVILGLNNKNIRSVKQFNQLLNKIESGRNIALLIKRGDMTSFLTMKLDDDEKE